MPEIGTSRERGKQDHGESSMAQMSVHVEQQYQVRREDLEELPYEEDGHLEGRGSTGGEQQYAAIPSLEVQQQQHQKQKFLTPDMAVRLAQKGSKTPLTMKDLKQLLTLRANGLGITGVKDLLCLAKLETLYLYDNLLDNAHGLSAMQRLTHLYLANNKITDMSQITDMPCLQKLYLQGNSISLVCGLRGMMSLEELHLSDQKLQQGTFLQFDPFAMQEVAASLHKLSALNCNITDDCLGTLGGLRDLRSLELAGNLLTSFEAVEGVVEGAPYLLHIDLRGNPLCKNVKYRETMIVMSDSLRTIDGHEVLESQRQSLLRLQVKKLKAEQRAEERAFSGRSQLPAQSAAGLASKPASADLMHCKAGHGQSVAQVSGLRGATGRTDLVGTPAGWGQPRYLAKQASQHQKQRALEFQKSHGVANQQGGAGNALGLRLAGALDGLQL